MWSLETRQEPKINMAEKLVDAIVKLRQRGKKDQPPKLLCDMQASLTFQQLLLLSSFFRLKELFHVNNGLTTSSLFFWKVPKIWVGRTTLNGEKKEDGHCRNMHGK